MRSHARPGAALPIVLMMVILFTALATSLIDLSVSRYDLAVQRQRDSLVQTSAESAANWAYDALQNGAEGQTLLANAVVPSNPDDPATWQFANVTNGGAGPGSINGCALSTQVALLRDDAPGQWGNEAYLIRSTATVGALDNPKNWKRWRVEMLLRPQPVQYFAQAMFSLTGYDFKNANTDSWDSRTGAYAPWSGELDHGDLGSNGQINTWPTSTVHGALDGNQNISLPTPTYDPPAGCTSLPVAGSAPGALAVNTMLTGVAGGTTRYRAASIDLTKNNKDTLSVQGGVAGSPAIIELYVDGDMQINYFRFSNDYTYLKIYHAGTAAGNDAIGCPGNNVIVGITGSDPMRGPKYPAQLIIITSTTSLFTFNGGSSFSGVIFAPKAIFKLNGGSDVFGSIVAYRFDTNTSGALGEVSGGFTFHYDEALGALDLGFKPTLRIAGYRAYPLAYGNN